MKCLIPLNPYFSWELQLVPIHKMAEVRNFTNNYRAKLSQNNRQWISLKITNRQKGFYVNLLERGPLLFPTTKHLFHFLILFFSFDFCFKISLVYLKKNYFKYFNYFFICFQNIFWFLLQRFFLWWFCCYIIDRNNYLLSRKLPISRSFSL